jgi:hypothetical protein
MKFVTAKTPILGTKKRHPELQDAVFAYSYPMLL